MNIDTLKSSILEWMGRTISDHKMEIAIELCEANFTYGVVYGGVYVDPLRIRAMETTATLTVNAESVALPTDYLGLKSIYIDYTPKVTPEFMEANTLRKWWPDNATGCPRNYAIEGEKIIFGPAPDDSYSAPIVYYKKIPPLTDSSPTNWVSLYRPDIYLYGAMAELENMVDGPNESRWQNKYIGAIKATNAQDKNDRVGGSALKMRAAPVGNRIVPR